MNRNKSLSVISVIDDLMSERVTVPIHRGGEVIPLQRASATAVEKLLVHDSKEKDVPGHFLETSDLRQRQVYDATAILGFGERARESIVVGEPGEIVIRYGGWSLKDLFFSSIGGDLIHDQEFWLYYPWANQKKPAGIYAMRLPIPDSGEKSFPDQTHLLHGDERAVPVVLGASALLAQHIMGGENHLKGNWTRCREKSNSGHVALSWYGGRLDVSEHGDDIYRKHLWLSSCRRIGDEVG